MTEVAQGNAACVSIVIGRSLAERCAGALVAFPKYPLCLVRVTGICTLLWLAAEGNSLLYSVACGQCAAVHLADADTEDGNSKDDLVVLSVIKSDIPSVF